MENIEGSDGTPTVPGTGSANNSRVPRLADDPMQMRGAAAEHYAFTITSRCQQLCPFCFEGAGAHDGKDMPFEEVCRHLEQVAGKVKAVVFMGAESTLHREFLKIVSYARSLGLRALVSSNLLRFADESFLRQCVDAGLSAFEFSFHYPDAAAFAKSTGTAARHFDRLLRAMENVGKVCQERNARADREWRYDVGPNLVVSALNVHTLGRVLGHVDRHLGPSFRQVTLKRLNTVSLTGAEVDGTWVANGEDIRRALLENFDAWPYPKVFPLLRNYPLCIAPGYEHLHADLLYHCREALVAQNFGKLPQFTPMYLYSSEKQESATGLCRSCSVLNLCRVLTYGAKIGDCPGISPIPSRREPVDILRDLGLGNEEAEAFLKRIGNQAADSSARLRPSSRPKGNEAKGSGKPFPLERTAINEVGRLLRGGKSKALEGITIESAATFSLADRSIRLDLLVDGRALSVALFARDYAGPFFFQSESFKVIHLKDGPAWQAQELGEVSKQLRLLITLIERRLKALRGG